MAKDNTRLVERITTTQQRIVEQQRAACSGPGCAESRAGMAFGRGERVLDTVTGKEGTIIAGRSNTTNNQPAAK